MSATRRTPREFDPLSTRALTRIIRREFEHDDLLPLPPDPFEGPGLYAIYYVGVSVELYRPLADPALKIPLYVGRARALASSTGRPTSPITLHDRLVQHAESISGAQLDLSEFMCRALIMPDVHINMGESGLMGEYQPVWNSVLTGFGSHEQGPTTRQSKRSRWDTVHGGRSRTFGDPNRRPKKELEVMVRRKIAWQIENYVPLD